MAPLLSTDPGVPLLDPAEQARLLAIARAAIATGPHNGLALEFETLPGTLQRERAVFVTLTIDGVLRGCIGSLAASAPLALAVADAAQGAAHRDPRFPPLDVDELAAIHIEISVLSELEPLPVDSRDGLLTVLRPGVDGLLLEDGPYRSTFLPKVWSQLPRAEDFVSQLLAKAGLPPDHWSSALRAHRYTTWNIEDDAGERSGGTAGKAPATRAHNHDGS